MLSDDFCIFILTNGRPNNQITYRTLMRKKYSGRLYFVVDDEDSTVDEYKKLYGDKVLVFSKSDVAQRIDEGDNFDDRRCILYARNVCFELAEKIGCRYFLQFDDDYNDLSYRYLKGEILKQRKIVDINISILDILEFYKKTPNILTVAISQGGDWIGGIGNEMARKWYKRKAMNSFFCDIQRPFKFYGRLNEDVNFYTNNGRKGCLILTLGAYVLNQESTQSSGGGMTDIYLDGGTYTKSFYSVMYSPSCVKIGLMGSRNMRLHHRVSWKHTVPMILSESSKKS